MNETPKFTYETNAAGDWIINKAGVFYSLYKAEDRSEEQIRWLVGELNKSSSDAHAKDLRAQLTADVNATHIYDSRDNREHKRRFWSAVCGQPMTIQEIPCAS